MVRRLTLIALSLLLARAAWADGYVVLSGVAPGDPYYAAAEALAAHHRAAQVLAFDPAHPEAVLSDLRRIAPEYVAVVLRPEQIEVNAMRRFLRFSTKLDDDPFPDFAFGMITGGTAEEATAFVKRIVRASSMKHKTWPQMVARASVGGGRGGCTADLTPYRVGLLSFPGLRLRFVAPDGKHGRNQAFIDEHLGRLDGCGAILLGGHGMPWEIGSGPRTEDLASLDLFPAVAFNYACYTGVTSTWPKRQFEGSTYLYRLLEVEPERSFALAMIRAGVTGYVAYVNPRPAGPEMTTEFERVLTGASLGAARRRDYDKITLGYLGFGESGIVPPEWVDGSRHPRNEVDPVRHMMLDGATGGVLYGDPALQPYPLRPNALPVQTRVERKGDDLHVTLTMEGSRAYLWGADPFRRFDAKSMAMKLYDRVELPQGLPEIRSVRTEAATWGGKRIDTLDPVWALETDQGRHYVHLKANFARGGRGDIRIHLVASPEAAPLDVTNSRDCRRLAVQVGEAVLAMRDQLDDPHAYDGKAGVSRFFFDLFRATKDERWRKAADQLLEEAAATEDDAPGLYVGLAGIGQVALDAWRITDEARYLAEAKALAARLGKPTSADVIGGAAGTGFFLLNLYAATSEDADLEAARALGAYLEETASRKDGEAFWPIVAGTDRVYIGFSHGASGIGTFLVHLARATGEEKWLDLAREAAAYVIGQAVDDSFGGWKWAKQPPPVEPDIRLQWCHGSPGIGLFFLALAEATGEPEHEAALGRCVAANLRLGRTARTNGCLCHGKAGNADCLLEVWRARRDPRLLGAARMSARDLCTGDRVVSRVGGRAYGPGLMTGLAGIGRFFLRLENPAGGSAFLGVEGGGPDAILEAVRAANRAALRAGAASEKAISGITRLGPAGYRAVIRLIASGEGHWRTHELLRALHVPGGETLLMALADGPPLPQHGRWTALKGLGLVDTPEVRTYLLARLQSEPDAGLYMSTARALGMLQETRAADPVGSQLLRFEEGWTGVESYLVLSLASMGPRAITHLEAFVADERATRAAGLSGALGTLETLDKTAARRAAKTLAASPRFSELGDRLAARVRRLAE